MNQIEALEHRIDQQQRFIEVLTKEVKLLNAFVKRHTDELIKINDEIESLYGDYNPEEVKEILHRFSQEPENRFKSAEEAIRWLNGE